MAQMPKYDTGDDNLVDEASQLLRSAFQADTGKSVCCMAPGRVNLIGEHTDYNQGFVMPLALKLRTVVVAVPTSTGICRIASVNQPGDIREINVNDNAPGKVGGWGKYVAGVIAQYTGELPTDGKFSFDAAFASNVPLGAGLSSSASLEVCTATLLHSLAGIRDDVVSGVAKALRCVEAEHAYANVPCGIMDQFISAMGKEDHLLLVDCRSNEPKAVPFLDKDVAIVVCNTNVTHSLDGSEYPDRVNQCKQAVQAIKQIAEKEAEESTVATKAVPSITHLRDVTPAMVQNAFDSGAIDEVVFKRAMHGTTEDQRTLKAAEALFASDYATVGELMKQSHKSLSEDYQVSTAELDALVDIAVKVDGVFGSRMTGGGFGGSTVTLVKATQVDALIGQLEKEYNPMFGINCSCMSTRPGAGAGVLFDRREGNASSAAAAASAPVAADTPVAATPVTISPPSTSTSSAAAATSAPVPTPTQTPPTTQLPTKASNMRVAVHGCGHGDLENIYAAMEVSRQSKGWDKVDLLIICGDFQAVRNPADLEVMACPRKYRAMGGFYKYYTGELVAPVLTLFVGGNHEASNYLQELRYGGFVAPNIYYMGDSGVVQIGGLRVGGMSGIFKKNHYRMGHYEVPPYSDNDIRSVYHTRQLEVFKMELLAALACVDGIDTVNPPGQQTEKLRGQEPIVDLFVSHDWPCGITRYGNEQKLVRAKKFFADEVRDNSLGSTANAKVMSSIRPSYWFAAHLHVKFAAIVPHPIAMDVRGFALQEPAMAFQSHQQNQPQLNVANRHVTRFLSLDKCVPQREFMQLLDVAIPGSINGSIGGGGSNGMLRLDYDLDWLAVVKATHSLDLPKQGTLHMPRIEDVLPHVLAARQQLRGQFSSPCPVSTEFVRTVTAFDPNADQRVWRNVTQAPQMGHPYTDALLQMLGIQHTGITIPYVQTGAQAAATAGAPVGSYAAYASGGGGGGAGAAVSDGPMYAVAQNIQVVGMNTNAACACGNDEEIDIDI